jgi:replicative DNA helicase
MGKKELNEAEEAARLAFRKKKLVESLKELDTEDVEDVVIGGEIELSNRETRERGELIHISELTEEIDKASKEWGVVGGMSTGLPSLDARIGGLRDGDIVMIAGNPGGGKSALAGNIAVNVAKTEHVLFISLEMLPHRIGARFKHYNNGTLEGLNISFQKESEIDYRHLRPLFESASKKDMRLVVLDYFQYLGRGMDMQEVAKMSVEMKKLAQEFGVPFIIILSLRKGGTQFKRKWTDVELEDLMGTSAIGYDADAVIVASRTDAKNNLDHNHQWLKIVKVRDMPSSDEFIRLQWDKTKITEVTEEWVPKPGEVTDMSEEELENLQAGLSLGGED